MHKLLVAILFILANLNLPVVADVMVKGGISYTVETARKFAFDNISETIPLSTFKDKLKDSKKRNKNFLKTIFSDGEYSITYKEKPDYTYYYSSNGNLIFIQINIANVYPKKSVRYDINGNLDSVGIELERNEQYIFDLDKKLYAHWIGKNGYNEKGELFGTRD